jgi:hypothetical protein
MDRRQTRQLLVARLFVSWRVVDIPTPIHPPVLGGELGDDDSARPGSSNSTFDDQIRQRKLAALRRFFDDVDAEVARLEKVKGRRAGISTRLPPG